MFGVRNSFSYHCFHFSYLQFTIYWNLNVSCWQGKYDDALSFYKRAVGKVEEMYGPTHLSIGRLLGLQANVLIAQVRAKLNRISLKI